MNEEDLKKLFIEAGEILDEIQNLPLDDHGYREVPPGMLDRAREISEIAFSLKNRQAS